MKVIGRRRAALAVAIVASGILAGCQSMEGSGPREYRADQAESSNMRLVGANDLQGRTAYQPTIHKQGNRYIAYIGHHGGAVANPLTGKTEDNGTSVVDVTDPKNPKYLAHIPGDKGEGEAGAAQMVRACAGSSLPQADRSKHYILRTFGNKGHEIWDVSVPEKPVLASVVEKGLRGTHKNWWECDTGIAYLISGVPEWRSTRMMQVYDLSNPAKPVLIRNFGVPGQEPGTGPASRFTMHGGISNGPKGNRFYLGYGTVSNGLIQIIDREKLLNGPKEPTPANLRAPVVAQVEAPPYWGAHTTLPILGMPMPGLEKYWGPNPGPKHRDILLVVNESTGNECRESRQQAYFMDITNEKTPFAISNFDVPEKSGNFCSRGGRFGAHSSNEFQAPMYDKRLVFITWFNAGVRAVDIRDPYRPKEAGYYIPAITAKTAQRCVDRDGKRSCKTAIQTNNVEVDDRGYVYIVDRANTGLHILEVTGAAREVAAFK